MKAYFGEDLFALEITKFWQEAFEGELDLRESKRKLVQLVLHLLRLLCTFSMMVEDEVGSEGAQSAS